MTDLRRAFALRRLRAQHLLGPRLPDPAAVVSSLGAVQSQDYPGAKWALALRCGATDDVIERAFNEGRILRTHVLRPTWHFVGPEDIRWMLALTAPCVMRRMAVYNRKMGLDSRQFRKSNAVLIRALRDGRQLTRTVLASLLARAGVNAPTGQHIGHLLMQAELEGLICSGARSGKHATYALLDERVPPAPPRDRDESLQELARRYFTTRGPATVHDFAWWSGLAIADAKRAVQAAGALLRKEERGGKCYWSAQSAPRPRATNAVHLLPNYDEYFIGYRDRSALGDRLKQAGSQVRSEVLMAHLVFVDGQVVGGWRRTVGARVAVEMDLLLRLSARERASAAAAAQDYGRYLQLPVELRMG